MKPKKLLLALLFLAMGIASFSQSKLDSVFTKIDPQKWSAAIESKADKIEDKLVDRSRKALHKMQREEERLKRKLNGIDSLAAKKLFNESVNQYQEFQKNLAEKIQKLSKNGLGNYIPYLDTLQNSLKFLQQNGSGEWKDKIGAALNKTDQLEGRFDQVNAIRQFLRERRQYLKEQLEKFGLTKQLKKFNKQVYYYAQLVKNYKEIFSDEKKVECLALSVLNKVPAFKDFMARNSVLASIFPVSTNNASAVSFTGIQTRASVLQAVQNSGIGSGPNPQQFIGQQLQTANSQLENLKSKTSFVDLSGNPEPMPDFKPNSQKTKPFFSRFELGANVQFGKINNLLPNTGEFAFSLGYKLNDNGTIGIGSSYKLGLGTSFRDIHFSTQGFGVRSFIDWKLKGQIYVSGGYERNYLPQLQNILILQNPEWWQESGLIGISKKYSVTKKRKGYVQILFDFLSYKNIPRSQPILFRTGINF